MWLIIVKADSLVKRLRLKFILYFRSPGSLQLLHFFRQPQLLAGLKTVQGIPEIQKQTICTFANDTRAQCIPFILVTMLKYFSVPELGYLHINALHV